jgi:ABC-type Fe3+/spermidine/putrescine transport system ATPase subunit
MKIQKLTKNFDPRGIAGVYDLDFELDSKKVVALLGPSGCGKTTTLNLINKTLTSDSGEITGNEKVLMLSTPSIFKSGMKLIDNLALAVEKLGTEEQHNLIRPWLGEFDLTNETNSNVETLSEGQKQRALIIHSLIQRPELLLLDEPFEHLEPNLKKELMNRLFEISRERGIGVFWVTHDLKLALSFSDEVMLMNFGKIVQAGKPEDVFHQPNSLFSAQYFGETNILVGKVSNNIFHSPIGKIPFEHEDGDDLCFQLKPHQLTIDESGDFKGRVQNRWFEGETYLYLLDVGGFDIYLRSSQLQTHPKLSFSLESSDLHQLPSL